MDPSAIGVNGIQPLLRTDALVPVNLHPLPVAAAVDDGGCGVGAGTGPGYAAGLGSQRMGTDFGNIYHVIIDVECGKSEVLR